MIGHPLKRGFGNLDIFGRSAGADTEADEPFNRKAVFLEERGFVARLSLS
jgi:hypothetical protein